LTYECQVGLPNLLIILANRIMLKRILKLEYRTYNCLIPDHKHAQICQNDGEIPDISKNGWNQKKASPRDFSKQIMYIKKLQQRTFTKETLM
jgi:hypothetical protein